ncbi:helix-turn-helix domain-containing protein [Faecalicatena orotica]|uniref:helix-turn-helix domain-containing protein n=1 Tax=Faecalicatena orotica TaxID=1544 RepID=UPI001FA8B7EB
MTQCQIVLPYTFFELDIPRSNFNRYCRNEFQSLDANLICKLCDYFECEVGELICYLKE